ncbi:DUF192 domain-containing protein [Haloquadratum walsbyi]|jgi:uncharacterized membrane protein (UPF0127 family)|uniref:DUF192 family protein n=1 Tax=Haloquadratum walsbyi (strain DSM 16790 / HBSQ001) TaxID=362976 RepID=Q18DV7_HALWD|nr:DUF192 domain-containing protein [Haloquadratum walsbyi]CAJ51270.1 DUF192 family protein [Haloquadratum walsbyi DSM 16790]
MNRTLFLRAVIVAIGVLVVGVIVITVIPGIGPTGEYDSETVKITDNKTGNQLERVSVRIADTPQKRYTGLSNTESLAEDEGMLFIHDSEDRYGYVMRDMSFPIDIIFIDATGTITRIYHAKVPTDTTTDELNRYSGRGRYVLEVSYNYTERHNITIGDEIQINRQ